jgi:hypothetical protein
MHEVGTFKPPPARFRKLFSRPELCSSQAQRAGAKVAQCKHGAAELGYRAGMWPRTSPPHENATGGRVSIFASGGRLLSRFGGGENPSEPGDFFAPHDIWLDSQGSLYVSEVVRSAAKGKKPEGRDYHTLQQFTKVNSRT